MDITLIYKQCEDHLFPSLKFTIRERALYYHLLRHTVLDGKPNSIFAIAPLAKALSISDNSVREDIRSLHERGCIKIEERSHNGHIVSVLLPAEIPGVLPEAPMPIELDLESLDFYSGRRFLTALLAREDSRCFYCLRSIRAESCELDHAVSQTNGRDNSFRNIVCSCHECNTIKQAQPPADFLRGLYRKGVLSQGELENRLSMLEQLQAGKLIPDLALLQSAL